MKKIYEVISFFIVFIISGCDTTIPSQKIGIYTYNMQYACECPQYKIFRVDDLSSKEKKLKDRLEPLDIMSKDDALSQEITNAINKPENDSLIGRDINISFNKNDDEQLFYSQQGKFPICYIYYFEGTFKDKENFMVDKFKLMLKSPDCIPDDDGDHN